VHRFQFLIRRKADTPAISGPQASSPLVLLLCLAFLENLQHRMYAMLMHRSLVAVHASFWPFCRNFWLLNGIPKRECAHPTLYVVLCYFLNGQQQATTVTLSWSTVRHQQ